MHTPQQEQPLLERIGAKGCEGGGPQAVCYSDLSVLLYKRLSERRQYLQHHAGFQLPLPVGLLCSSSGAMHLSYLRGE